VAQPQPQPEPVALEMRGIVKQFPGVLANDNVDFDLRKGEVHALLGENGAGKSTLMNILYGLYNPDAGEVLLDGKPVSFRSSRDAIRAGIGMVHQHFMLIPVMTVAENIVLAVEPTKAGVLLDYAAAADRVRAVGESFGFAIDPEALVEDITVGQQQRVEIMKALYRKADILILDEPTAVLTPQEAAELFEILASLKADGMSIIFISHKLNEVLEIADRITVLRRGKKIDTVPREGATEDSLARMMVGRDVLFEVEKPPASPGDVLLEVEGLRVFDDRGIEKVRNVSLAVRAGEIVGIAGVSGNGQQELLAALSGEDPRAEAAAIELRDVPIGRMTAGARRKLGLHFVPEERLGRGAVPALSLAQNLLLTRKEALRAFGWIDRRALRRQAEGIIDRFHVKAAGPGAAAKSLSGGNLQKYIVGREIDATPKVFVVAQPTWGVDVGAAAQIRSELLQLRDAGCAVLLVSEELEELFEMTDRLHVIHRGRLSPCIPTSAASYQLVGEWMSGLWPPPEPAAPAAGAPPATRGELR